MKLIIFKGTLNNTEPSDVMHVHPRLMDAHVDKSCIWYTAHTVDANGN